MPDVLITASVVGIWNRALARIGTTRQISAIDENSVEAAACVVHWADVLKECLEDFPWPFAKRQTTLAELSSVTRVGWEHVYALPADFLSARAILSGSTRLSLVPSESRTPHEIMADDAAEGLVLCCDLAQDDIDALEYTGLVTNPGAYSGAFSSAAAWKLASELELSVGSKDPRKAQSYLAMYDREIAHAFAAQLRSNRDDQPLEGSGIRARS